MCRKNLLRRSILPGNGPVMRTRIRPGSLKARLALGAGLISTVAVLAGALTGVGMARMGAQLDASLVAERRIARYAVLSTQASSFIVVGAEAIQAGLPPGSRADRLAPVADDLSRTFAQMRADLEQAVDEAQALGLDEQSRRATQSIGIARMEALFFNTRDALVSEEAGRERLQGFLDVFSHRFDTLLNAAVIDEIRTREQILARIADLRRLQTVLGIGVSAVAALMLAVFYFGLVRPQLNRLDLARSAARRIGNEDFAVALPEGGNDEIGRLFAETNRTAAALARRQQAVAREWARLNETIEERTEELRAANAALARTDENRRRFFADLSHELRTPLTVILMEAELALKGPGDPRAAFETIEARARRLNRRIDDLLRLAKSESGQIDLASAPVDLARVVAEAVAETGAEMRSAGLDVTVRATGPVPVMGDTNWLRQGVVGLIRNAVRHARAGGRLDLVAGCEGGLGCVRVIDNGPGIPAEDQARVLRRFDRGRNAGGEGFGIGLALIKWVVEQQQGRIDLASPVPAPFRLGDAPGTMIAVSIPCIREGEP